MNIREYTIEDKEAIISAQYRFQGYLAEIDDLKLLRCNPGYGEAYTEDLLKKVTERGGKIFVAEEGEKIVGFVAGVFDEQSDLDKLGHKVMKYGDILDLFVEEEFRGTGIGKELMNKMEDYFRSQKCDVVVIEVFGPNNKAHQFYEQLGYADRDYRVQKILI